MKEKRDCRIIQDLLPTYIEKLTSQETNNYIEEHLKECTECNKILTNMKKNIKIENNKVDKTEINYFKKYNKKINFLKLIILIIIIIFLIIIGRKALILITLSEKAKNNINSNNYYVRLSQYEGDTIYISEIYKKEDKQIISNNYYDNTTPESNYKWIEYTNKNITNFYMESNNEKVAFVNVENKMLSPMEMSKSSSNYHQTIWNLLKNSMLSSVRTVKCNGKDCYYFSNLENDTMAVSEVNSGIYIDKETGLPIRTVGGTITSNKGTTDPIIEFDYKFDNITDKDIKEPDITQYKIHDNH